MSGREKMRRAGIWAVVVAFFASLTFVLSFGGDPTPVGFIAYPIVGAIILTSRPRNGVGRFLLAVALAWTVSSPLLAADFVAATPAWLESVGIASGWLLWGLLPLVGLVFPSGHVETRLGRALAWSLTAYVAAATVASLFYPGTMTLSGRPNPLGIQAAVPLIDVVIGPLGTTIFVVLIVGILVDLGLRWRSASGSVRLQYRWLVFGLVTSVVVVAVGGTLNTLLPEAPWVPITTAIAAVVTNLIPISIGIAVTRHGLYEINRVVSRTVAYAIVTALAVGVYALVVTSITWLLPTASSVAVAAATLAAAALFLPVLRAVQRVVDRRFDRERYDAERVVEEFGMRLRSDVHLEETTDALTHAVERTLRPGSVGVWTKAGAS